MTRASTVAAVVLAAGASTRLGRPKGLLTRDGETLAHRCVRLALQLRPACAVMVTGAEHAALRLAVEDLPVTLLRHRGWAQGMASSLRAGLSALPSAISAALVLVVDQPALSASHLEALLAAHAGDPARAVGSRYAGIVGVPAMIPRALFACVPERGDRGLAGVLRAGDAVAVDDDDLALDVDDMRDVERAVARGLLDRPVS